MCATALALWTVTSAAEVGAAAHTSATEDAEHWRLTRRATLPRLAVAGATERRHQRLLMRGGATARRDARGNGSVSLLPRGEAHKCFRLKLASVPPLAVIDRV